MINLHSTVAWDNLAHLFRHSRFFISPNELMVPPVRQTREVNHSVYVSVEFAKQLFPGSSLDRNQAPVLNVCAGCSRRYSGKGCSKKYENSLEDFFGQRILVVVQRFEGDGSDCKLLSALKSRSQ